MVFPLTIVLYRNVESRVWLGIYLLGTGEVLLS